MSDTALDRFYYQFNNNVVLRDENGNPSIFVKHPKVNSSFFDSTYLPDTPHPAFWCGLDDNNEPIIDDAILIGKYHNSLSENNETYYSLPNRTSSFTMSSVADLKNKIGAFGHNAVPLTVADHGLLMLIAHKFGDIGMRGSQVQACDSKDIYTYWRTGISISASNLDNLYGYRGWVFKPLIAHTTSAALNPEVAPDYWKRIKKVGGVTDPNVSDNDLYFSCLTGSGPISFYLLCDPALESDIIGRGSMPLIDYRIKDCEIQIIPYNKAALPTTDVSANSSEWRAILPNENDNGCSYVAPGTEGTLHFAWKNNKITLVNYEPGASERSADSGDYKTTKFNQISVDSSVPIVPSILYELGIIPIPGTSLQGEMHAYRLQLNRTNNIKVFGHHTANGMGSSEEVATWNNEMKTTRTRIRVPAETSTTSQP